MLPQIGLGMSHGRSVLLVGLSLAKPFSCECSFNAGTVLVEHFTL